MRYFCSAISLGLVLAFLSPPAWTQCPGGSCPGGSCPPGGIMNCWVPGPYPRYPGYGVSSSNYYTQPPPPFLAGGPAYGYTYPYPWSAMCVPPRNYISPAYPGAYYYPFYGQSHSYYSSYPPNYQGTNFATERTSSYPPPSTQTAPPVAPAKPSAPPAKSTTSAKTPATLPDTVPAKNDPTAAAAATDTPKKPLWRRLLFLPN